jgi:hypothetical protein
MYQCESYHRGCLHHPSPTLEVREGEIMAEYGKMRSCSQVQIPLGEVRGNRLRHPQGVGFLREG